MYMFGPMEAHACPSLELGRSPVHVSLIQMLFATGRERREREGGEGKEGERGGEEEGKVLGRGLIIVKRGGGGR